MTDRRRGPPRRPKNITYRLDEILEDKTDHRWSSLRVALFLVLFTYLGLSIADPQFRDPGAFVTLLILLVSAIVGPRLVKLQVLLGKVSEAIERRTRSRSETETTVVHEQQQP